MSVRRRRLTTATGAVLLALAVAGCSGLGRTAVGTLSYETQRQVSLRVTSPPVKGCHRLAPSGVTHIRNDTLVDFVMYTTRDCRGKHSVYVPTSSSNLTPPGTLPWRSYRIIH
ncbi:hypothetical protein [Streptomyces sp. NPDC094049]|uniref:hypothetical protein n=1 Tax=Streptomyces sp. NPDC094049 TaxID=3154987 RepID=UPI003331F50B